jgi:3-methyladenine DNA glycosylase AlkD
VPRAEAERLADEIEVRLAAHADPERAVRERAYLKSDLRFLGTGMTAVRAVAREWRCEHRLDRPALLVLVEAMWRRGLHELRAVAIFLLQREVRQLQSSDITFVERLLRDSHTWAYVDELAARIAGALVEREASLGATLDRWATDEDFWVRRSAMLALLGPIRAGGGDFDRFARYADAMIEEREFFIRKAIGWVLREASKRRHGLVAAWLVPRAARASGVTIREAVKYLPAADRAAILAAYAAGRAHMPRCRA